ncbi:MAG: hypothetical protein ABH816_02750 [Candidatus Levyibacteriota bacterium]
MKKIILFDIDYTLFDTQLFREKLYKSIANALGCDIKDSSENIDEMYDEIRAEKGYFQPKIFSLQLARKLGREKDAQLIEKAIFAKENFKNCLYKESLKAIEKLSKIISVGIFSKGYNSFQRNKIKVLKNVLNNKNVHIFVNKRKSLPKIIDRYKDFKLYIIDDALDVLFEAWKLRKDIVTIWVKRGIYAKNQKPIENFKPDAIIKNLGELISVIK